MREHIKLLIWVVMNATSSKKPLDFSQPFTPLCNSHKRNTCLILLFQPRQSLFHNDSLVHLIYLRWLLQNQQSSFQSCLQYQWRPRTPGSHHQKLVVPVPASQKLILPWRENTKQIGTNRKRYASSTGRKPGSNLGHWKNTIQPGTKFSSKSEWNILRAQNQKDAGSFTKGQADR